ncbi:hypothetical protein M0Q97_04175 [Candidatus Dojkabacteria bacterium]|jgi:hypothetical protein|nr:hypothetical protein [Candidatus Dojkabacteria bacterium]
MKYLKTFENFKPIKNNLEKPFKLKKNIDKSILHLQKSIKALRRRIPSENDIKKRTKMTLDANKKVRDLAELQLKKIKQNIYLNEHPIDENFLNENKNNNIDDVYSYFKNKDLDYELQENLENAYEELKTLIKNNTIKAYRLLNIDDINKIDKNNLGKHFTIDKENTASYDFLEKIGVIDYQGNYDYEKFFVIEIETNISNIDWYQTFDNRINYYGENEINFINNTELKIINIEEVEIVNQK